MVLERIRAFNRSLPSDEEFGNVVKRLALGAETFADPTALGRSVQPVGRDFIQAVQATRELLRAQLPQSRQILGGKLDTISNAGGQLAVDAGLAATLDDGIVLFHRKITEDKPSLRAIFNKSDRRAGRLQPPKVSTGQKILRLAVRGGLMKRTKEGKFVRLTPAATRLLKRERSRAAAKRNQATIKRQATARERLKGFK